MDFTIKSGTSTPEITTEIAQAIYAEVKEHGSADCAYKCQSNSEYDPEHFVIVDKEGDRVIKELRAGCVNSTQTALLSSVTSDLLDVSVLLEDDKNGRTYAQYVQDNTPEEVI